MKTDPRDWEEEDLLELIQIKAEENLHRDWKESGSLERTDRAKREISKDISSFANSDGGIVVYGIEQEKQPPYAAKALSPIDAVQFSHEWLEDIITSNVDPPVHDLVIRPIYLNTQHPGKVAHVVIIPRSSTAHMANDGRYYRRYNFKALRMEDYEVRLSMNRTSWPTYHASVRMLRVPGATKYKFDAIVRNSSEIVARDVSLQLLVPVDLTESRHAVYGRETIDQVEYQKLPGSRALNLLYPEDPQVIQFERDFLVIPDPPEAYNCIVFVRVYDQFGRAHEVRCQVRLHPDVSLVTQEPRPREKIL
jgi:hypothetical protein